MSYILSIGTVTPPHYYSQEKTKKFIRELFETKYKNIERLLTIFQNGQIDGRYFSAPMEWFKEDHSFAERNSLYVELATDLGVQAIKKTLENSLYLENEILADKIDAIFFISSSGISTPSIEARIMNKLPFSTHTKRIPIWGLGCAGGAAGMSRAHEYCMAYPTHNVIVLSVELCSLTFQKADISKSNLIGTSLFADGVACTLICGENSELLTKSNKKTVPRIVANQSTFMPESENVMGWEVKNTGLHVIFSKDIPTIIKNWLQPNLEQFLSQQNLSLKQVSHFIAHPGGKKVLDAYESSLQISADKLNHSLQILKNYGNMSSTTVLFVMELFLSENIDEHEYGVLFALGPGFSAESVLLQWTKLKEES